MDTGSAIDNFISQHADMVLDPYELDERGVTRRVYDQTGARTEVISPIPIVPTALLRNVDTDTEKIELSFLKHGRWRKVICERSVAASNNGILRLADKGIEVNSDNAKKLVKYIAKTTAYNLDTLPNKAAKSVMGWHDGVFMPYTDDIVFDGDEQFKHLYKALCSRGNLQEWTDFIAPLRDKIEVRLCMAAAFASPLIELIGENPFVFHLWGQTGTGKTVALLLAMSIFGNPTMGGLTRTMNMTANSMLSTAAFLKNLPFAGDELQTIKSRWTNYDSLIMVITEGIDRGRMSYDRVNETKAWKCSFIFTGEEPCTKAESGGGVKNRVIEIELTDKLIPNGNQAANFVRTHYGCAGRPYIEELQRIGADQLTERYNGIFNAILSKTDTTDKQAGSAALLVLADQIATGLFWPNERPLALHDITCYLSSAKDVDVSERAYQYVINLIAKNAANFTEFGRENWGRANNDNVLINKLVLEEQLAAKGFDFDAVKKKWRETGKLITNSQGKMYHQTKCYNAKGTFIKIRLPSDEEEPKQDEDLPF